jgi:hypothetical protein
MFESLHVCVLARVIVQTAHVQRLILFVFHYVIASAVNMLQLFITIIPFIVRSYIITPNNKFIMSSGKFSDNWHKRHEFLM